MVKIIVFTILVSLFCVSIQNIEAAGAKKGYKGNFRIYQDAG